MSKDKNQDQIGTEAKGKRISRDEAVRRAKQSLADRSKHQAGAVANQREGYAYYWLDPLGQNPSLYKQDVAKLESLEYWRATDDDGDLYVPGAATAEVWVTFAEVAGAILADRKARNDERRAPFVEGAQRFQLSAAPR